MKKLGLLFGTMLSLTISNAAMAAVDFSFLFDPQALAGPSSGNAVFNARITNTGTENIVALGADTTFSFGQLSPYVTAAYFGSTTSFSDFENQFAGLSLAPGSSFAFAFGNLDYSAPSGLYSVGTDSFITFRGTSGDEVARTVGNAAQFAVAGSAVPEPATWAMMLAGFGMVGAGLRRGGARRTKLGFAF